MRPVTFFADTTVVVVGNNPEMADYTNPRGELYAFAAFVYAEDRSGYRRRLHVGTSRLERESLQPAESLALALQARLKKLGKLPVGFDGWDEARPAYGSAAHDPEEAPEFERQCRDSWG
jgi:hypothetical protein